MDPVVDKLPERLKRAVGRTIADRYEIRSLLGAGANGAVFTARDNVFGQEVAVKFLHPRLSLDPEIVKRFDREARVASRIDHFNCCNVTDFGTDEEGLKYVVMPYLVGRELSGLTGEPMPLVRALDLFRQMLEGLDHAHLQGIVHRDLKPENIIIARDAEGGDVLKITDFGIAKIVLGSGSGDQVTRAGRVTGSPEYMSPEQAQGKPLDGRCDLYCAGLILYEMLTSERAFDSDNPLELMHMQVKDPAPQLPGNFPPEVRALVDDLLRKDPDQRPGDARATIERVVQIQEDLGFVASPRRGLIAWFGALFGRRARRTAAVTA